MSPSLRHLVIGVGGAVVVALLAPVPSAAAAELPSITATYTVGSSPNAVGITPDGRRILSANAGSNNVSVISRSTGLVTAVTAGANPLGVVITPDGSRAYVSNWLGQSATVIDVPAASAVATIPLNDRPEAGAVSGDGSTVFIPSAFNPPSPAVPVNEIAKISTASNTVLTTMSSANPGCVVVAPDGVTFVSCRAVTNSVGLFTVSSVSVTTVALSGGAATAAVFSPDSRTAYLANSILDAVNVLDVASATVTATMAVGDNPNPIAVRPDGQRVFVGNQGDSTVSVLSASGAVIATTPVGGSPSQIGVSHDGQFVLVTTSAGSLVVLDSTGTQILTTLTLGGTPGGLAVARIGDFAAISLSDANRVVIVNLPPAPATGDLVPRAALQQFARQVNADCSTAPADLADFPALGPAVRNEAWGPSWAQWPNGGAGGFVCTRQPYYTTSGAWSVR
jgi:YVTN family beta-propeller protein